MNWTKINLKEEKYAQLKVPNVDPQIDQLYISGNMPDLNNSIAVVGSRRVSEYGKRACREFVDVLAKSGITIISGLMYGVDIEAHNAAINAGGQTVGVLGYGHSHLSSYGYASTLYRKILSSEAGAVVSEYDPEVPPAKWTFPKRNRVIAALSKAVLVIEAGEHSGSLITAGYAVEQGKDVFAVPGSIYSLASRGTNWIIKQGAHPATSPEDILLYFNKAKGVVINQRENLTNIEQKILEKVEQLDKFAFAEKIGEILKLPAKDLSIKLSSLELGGFVSKDISGRFYVLK